MLNTHNLDIILQLKYMPIVMNPARIASSDWNPRNAMFFDAPYLQNDFFYVFNIILSFSTCSQSFKKNLYVGKFGRERLLKHTLPTT